MKIEKVKKDNKLKIVISIFGVIVLISAIVYVNTRAKYQTIDSIRLASGAVTFNAADFDLVDIYLETDVAHSTHEYNSKHYKSSNSLPTSGYTIDTATSYCIVENSDGIINKENTHIGITEDSDGITFSNVTKRGSKCYLYYDEVIPLARTLIASANKTSITTSAGFGVLEPKSGVTPAPGLYEFDGMTSGSKTQFYRGAVTNNYIRLGKDSSNYTYWRIVRFDEEGNIRLIYDGTRAHDNGETSEDRMLTTNYNGTSIIGQAYYRSKINAAYVGWTWVLDQQWPNNTVGGYPSGGSPSDMKNYLENTWLPAFKNKLSTKEKGQLITGKYCNDRTVESGNWYQGSWIYFGARRRLETNKTPSFACDTRDTYTLEVGLLTADEYSFAGGGGYQQINTTFYLYTGWSWVTMSPSYWDGSWAHMFYVYDDGYFDYLSVDQTSGIRPVITLNKNTIFNSTTNGTKDKPYTIAN